MIKRVFSVGLLGLLLLVSAMAQDEAYIVTDLKGAPEWLEEGNRWPIKLLGKMSAGKLDLSEGETLTLTRLSDGERIVLSGRIVAAFDPTRFSKLSGDGSIKQLKGRLTSTQELRKVSSTLGAGSVRVGEPILLTSGPVLNPEIAWLPTWSYPDCQITLKKDDEVIAEWQKLKGDYDPDSSTQTATVVSLADLSLLPEEPYFISFTPLREEKNGDLVFDKTHAVETDFKLVNAGLAEEAKQKEAEARRLYAQDPSDLTPLSSYLAFLWHNHLLGDAIRLVYEPPFNEQGGTRTHLLNELKNAR